MFVRTLRRELKASHSQSKAGRMDAWILTSLLLFSHVQKPCLGNGAAHGGLGPPIQTSPQTSPSELNPSVEALSQSDSGLCHIDR